MSDLHAFHNDPVLQRKYLDRVDNHYRADELVQGQYTARYIDGGDLDSFDGHSRVCAVGCTIHSNMHNHYPDLVGIPEELAFVQEMIFERTPLRFAKEWARDFLHAIPLGADLSGVVVELGRWLMTNREHGLGLPGQALDRLLLDHPVDESGHMPNRDLSGFSHQNAIEAFLRVAHGMPSAGIDGLAKRMIYLTMIARGWVDALPPGVSERQFLGTKFYEPVGRKLLELLQAAPVPDTPAPLTASLHTTPTPQTSHGDHQREAAQQ